jgi:hypothetical protein
MNEITEQAILMEKNERTLKSGDDKSLTVRFKLMSAETQNENNRIYPKEVLSKAVERLKARIAKRRDSFAASGHKDDPQVDDATAFLEDVEMQGNDVYATARVVNTQKGANIITLLKNGAALGVSAKGRGAMDGNRVKPGFELLGFDWTLSPGFGTYASKANIIESVTVKEEDTTGAVTLAELEQYGLVENDQDLDQVLQLKYQTARQAGFAGDFQQFKETFDRTAAESLVEKKFAEAQRAGYKGSLAEYRAALSIKK